MQAGGSEIEGRGSFLDLIRKLMQRHLESGSGEPAHEVRRRRAVPHHHVLFRRGEHSSAWGKPYKLYIYIIIFPMLKFSHV